MTRRAVPVFVMTVLVLAAGCSSDDTADPPNSSSTSTTSSIADTTTTTAGSTTSPTAASPTTASPSTTSEVPTTSAPDALESTIQDLLDRYDAAVTAILNDPTVTSDPSSPAVTTYLALFAPGSTFAQGALSSWAQDAANGRSYRAGPSGSMIDSSLVELTSASDTEASFNVCAANSLQVLDSAGNVIESSGGVTFVQAVAELVDSQWLLRDLSQSAGDCPKQEPGA